MINKMMKVSMVIALFLVTVVGIGATKASAETQGCWGHYPDGKWYYFTDSAFRVATNTVIDGKYRVDSTGAWDGITMDSNATQVIQNSNVNQSVQNDGIAQVAKDTDSNTISYEEFTKIADDTMLNLVNAHRKENGLDALEWDQILANMSTEKSQHMVDHNYMGHEYKGITTLDVQSIAWKYNIDNENILDNYSFPITKDGAIAMVNSMFNLWKNSSGHDRTMLENDYRKFGFGFAFSNGKADWGSYGTQQFARKRNGYVDQFKQWDGTRYVSTITDKRFLNGINNL